MTMAQIRTASAACLTIAIIAFFAVIVCLRWEEASALPLNNLGDLLAGVVAPIAFLWLAVGYFQQGEELRQNTAALIQQKRELERQVEETAKLAQFPRSRLKRQLC